MNFRLQQRCRIERKIVTLDEAYGSESIAWGLLAVVWCNLTDTPPSRSEQVRTGMISAKKQSVLRIRYRKDLDSSMRVVMDGNIYQIVGGIAELGNHEFNEIVLEQYTTL